MKTYEIVQKLRELKDNPDPKQVGFLFEVAAKRLNELDVKLDKSMAYLEVLNEDIGNNTVKWFLEQNREGHESKDNQMR